eukprot:175763-Amphidinium_carterae.1
MRDQLCDVPVRWCSMLQMACNCCLSRARAGCQGTGIFAEWQQEMRSSNAGAGVASVFLLCFQAV